MTDPTYDPAHDGARLRTLRERVLALMRDGNWRTDAEIQSICGGNEGGVGAKRRDLKKSEFGGHKIQRRRRGDPVRALWEYRLVVKPTEQQDLFDHGPRRTW